MKAFKADRGNNNNALGRVKFDVPSLINFRIKHVCVFMLTQEVANLDSRQ